MHATLSFFGAARTVTGSKHLLEVDGKRILIDCGMFQGRKELRDRNWAPFPFDPAEIDALVLTHAHQDHLGMIPRLIKLGYRGPVYCTRATKGLADISMPDGGRIQEEDAYHARKRGILDRAEPLYTEADAYAASKQFKTVPYKQLHDLPGGCSFRFIPAGHILGSAYAEINLPNGEKLLMGGDLGRWDTPIIKDPELVDHAEYVVMESTYGDKLHPDANPKEQIHHFIHEAIKSQSVLIVPSFAIGRTQELLYYISQLEQEGRIGRIPIFVDSPMASSTSVLYGRSPEEWDDEMKMMLQADDTPLEPQNLTYVRDRAQSKELNSRSGPMMIIAGSGMANGGRVVHHLLHRLSNPSTIVLFTGYQAEETLGRELLEGAETVQILRNEVQVRARIERVSALSAHADQRDMFRFLGGFQSPPKKTFLVHGEPDVQDVLAAKIRADLGWNVEVPEQGQVFELR